MCSASPCTTGSRRCSAASRPGTADVAGARPADAFPSRRPCASTMVASSSVSATSIASIDTRVLELELTEPFGISGGSQEKAGIVLVELSLGDGTRGLGEAAPLPAYNGERVEDAVAGVAAAREVLLGANAAAWRQRALDVRVASARSASARCALETALVDALARQQGLSLYEWFGGCSPARLVTDVTIPIMAPEAAQQAAERWWARGFHSLKV